METQLDLIAQSASKLKVSFRFKRNIDDFYNKLYSKHSFEPPKFPFEEYMTSYNSLRIKEDQRNDILGRLIGKLPESINLFLFFEPTFRGDIVVFDTKQDLKRIIEDCDFYRFFFSNTELSFLVGFDEYNVVRAGGKARKWLYDLGADHFSIEFESRGNAYLIEHPPHK